MSFDPVQSVTKAFTVLEYVNRRGLASIKDIHETTGIPKPTIVRLLQTLVGVGYVAQDERTRGYHVTATVNRLSSGFHGAPMVIEVAHPLANALTDDIMWPCAICMLDLDAVVINYSTTSSSPIAPFHASLGRRLSLGGRALGRAYACFCPQAEQDILRSVMRTSRDPENYSITDEAFKLMVSQARKDGFVERNADLEPRSSGTIAFPIMLGERVMATFGVTYFRSAIDKAQTREALIDKTRDTVTKIEAALEAAYWP
ncbi:transcriptional regulator (plasmid) [Pseudorhodobacter turbinis]|uniref:Transcriptional regulator n=1 Tax=Pseudorhodobacter turbinis TaxID=2500533 RepID=A0A4P8EJL8_9RHOB|nr:helix-turn-helix domain-containing protein [Pseudorhodobacter turbinis]QCO57380.1 transcriptional regulator [Pseudorhodobacter turbinis]